MSLSPTISMFVESLMKCHLYEKKTIEKEEKKFDPILFKSIKENGLKIEKKM